MKTGVYKIENKTNGKFYIGSAAVSFGSRKTHHFGELRRGIHPNRILQNSFNKHGEEVFSFSILAYCPPEHCLKIEQWYIDNTKPHYNICKIAGSSIGTKRSEEDRKKMSIARKGIPTGRSIKHSEETKARISQKKKGMKLTEEWKAKINKFQKGMEAWNKGKKMPAVSINNTKRLCIYQYQIKTPSGEIVSTDNLFAFSKANKLESGKLGYTFSGIDHRGYRVKSCKGYKIVSRVLKTEIK